MDDRSSGIVVFAGPTLPRDPGPGWQALLRACDLRPPAVRGDVLAALAGHPHTIVLLDGCYYTVPSVTHKELLYALDGGVRVLGAASLGALRAVELAPFGMIGIGAVFEQYRTGALDGDDEVALLHAPAEHGYRPLTVALVEVRHALARLGSTVPPDAVAQLIADLKALSFLDRDPVSVTRLASRRLGVEAAAELDRLLAAGSVKQDDARQALELAVAGKLAPPAPRRRAPSSYVGDYKEMYLRCPGDGPDSPLLQRAWRLAQLFHPEAPAFVRQMRRRALLVSAAVHQGLDAPGGEEEGFARDLRRLHEERWGRPILPEPEYGEESRFERLAAAACRHAGGESATLQGLAQSIGPDCPDDEETLVRLLAARFDALPTWWLVRTFTFTDAFPAAVEAARAVGEIHGCFERWARGSRVSWEDLRALAARLWRCKPDQMEAEADRRALFPASGLSGGLREALELVIAAERLPRPINDWPDRRDVLVRAPLEKQLVHV